MSAVIDAAYGKAAHAIYEAAKASGARQFVFTSAFAREGTTTTALNVARRLRSNHGLNPLLIEFGVARPALARWLELDPERGVGAIAKGTCAASEAIQRDETGLHVIVSDGDHIAADVHLMSPALELILRETDGTHDVILIDAPPILTSPHVGAVLSLVPRVVLVVEAGRVPEEALERVAQALAERKVEVVASILNKHKRYVPSFIYRRLTGHES